MTQAFKEQPVHVAYQKLNQVLFRKTEPLIVRIPIRIGIFYCTLSLKESPAEGVQGSHRLSGTLHSKVMAILGVLSRIIIFYVGPCNLWSRR